MRFGAQSLRPKKIAPQDCAPKFLPVFLPFFLFGAQKINKEEKERLLVERKSNHLHWLASRISLRPNDCAPRCF
jgi:hypothetical protein